MCRSRCSLVISHYILICMILILNTSSELYPQCQLYLSIIKQDGPR